MILYLVAIIALAIFNIRLMEYDVRQRIPVENVKATATVSNSQTILQPIPAPAWEFQDCDFESLYGGASLLERPLDVAYNINLRHWQAGWRQFGELTRLINVHQGALIKRHGAEEFHRFRADMKILIERPLRQGCSTLQRLQTRLLEFKDIDINEDEEIRAILSNIVREAEIEVVNNILENVIRRLLPSWARRAPELRSENCPSKDCFRIGKDPLDISMFKVPNALLAEVRRVQSDIAAGAARERGVFGFMNPWS
ncbi:hypothetical protein F4859DRAFT_520976 [Xylaria cf. heliscus]|nr:hypothetical protein F4859DRAFT_520976 [Xylaria cf. heliscus]